MRVEIKNASNFLTNLLRLKCGENFNVQRLEDFASKLETMLRDYFQQHWFPESPCKGSAYRCIRINHKMDPILSRAGSECGFDEESLKHLFPHELTLWIDPREVSYRIGENGSICVLYDGTSNSASPNLPNQSHKKSGNKASTPKSSKYSLSPNNNSSCPNLPNSRTWTPTPPKNVANHPKNTSNDEDDAGSPMSMSPPSPVLARAPTCKESLRETGFIMDPRNINFELSTYVAS